MEPVRSNCFCLKDLTPEQLKKADAVAGGSFAKILAELRVVRASFGTGRTDPDKKNSLPEFKRAQDIMRVFNSEESRARKLGNAPFFLEKKFSIFGPSIIKTMI